MPRPEEALEEQIKLIKYFGSDAGLYDAAGFREAIHGPVEWDMILKEARNKGTYELAKNTTQSVELYAKMLKLTIMAATPYWVAPHVHRYLTSMAGDAYRDRQPTLNAGILPTDIGFLYIPDAETIYKDDFKNLRDDKGMVVVNVAGIMWSKSNNGLVSLWVFIKFEGVKQLAIIGYLNWKDGESFDKADCRMLPAGKVDNVFFEDLAKLFSVFAWFTQQRLTKTSHRPSRPERKRASEAGWVYEPIIQVITLRKTDYVRLERYDRGKPVNWSCQWEVEPHTRTYHRGTPNEFTIPIKRYRKGPKDKPLKKSSQKIYAVRR